MAGPSMTDEKLAERIDALAADLAEFRLDAERRSGAIETALSDIRGDMKELRGDLKWIKLIGGSIVALLIAFGAASGRVIWDASAVSTDVKYLQRDTSEARAEVKAQRERLDAMDKKLDLIISRTAPKPGG